jgi:dolichyl-phosphate-mannose-protein mannosyltransferase
LTGPAVGEPDPAWAAPPGTGSRDGAVGVLGLLVAGLAFRLIIAYVLVPNSGFGVDIQSFQYWADNLARQGLGGFYDRDFFHDYTPGYLYVLWLVGKIAQVTGQPGVGDLIKLPPILADAALGWVVWSMARELGASKRSAWIGAFIVMVNPVSWFDSALWGQVDSVGTVVMLLALRELWRDRPERSAVLAVLAALIKPQLGILIPIVAVVVIRRAFWPRGAYGEEPPPTTGATAWERRVRGPIRVLTTGVVGFATAILLSIPFGLSLPGLVQQVFSTAGGYPYLTVNAYNPWALVTQAGNSLAANRSWICDANVLRPGRPRSGSATSSCGARRPAP